MKKIADINKILQGSAKNFVQIANKKDFVELKNFYNKINFIFLKPGIPKFLLNKILNLDSFLQLSDINKNIVKILIDKKCFHLIQKLYNLIENLISQKIIIYYTKQFNLLDFELIQNQIDDYNTNFNKNSNSDKNKILNEIANEDLLENDYNLNFNKKPYKISYELEQLINYLKNKQINKPIKLQFELDENLIKGIKIKINDQVFENSVARNIKELKNSKFLL
ncbi:MAG: F0F1 ATP synthase subunit delta [Rickettsiales bacterium]